MAVSMRVAELATDALVSMQPIDTTAGEHYRGVLGTLSSEQLRMLELARRWAPYGGVRSSDVLVEFGVSKLQFYARIRDIVGQLQGAV